MCVCVLADHKSAHSEFVSDLRSFFLCQGAALIFVAQRPQDLSGTHSSMQVTARMLGRSLTAGLWLPYKPPSPGLYLEKKSQILTPFHWANFRGSFCGDCLTVQLLCSSTSLPSHGILYLQLSERRGSFSCSVPLASLALWTDAIIFTVFRTPLCRPIVNIAYNAPTSALQHTVVRVCTVQLQSGWHVNMKEVPS